jgi:hypothetical protein
VVDDGARCVLGPRQRRHLPSNRAYRETSRKALEQARPRTRCNDHFAGRVAAGLSPHTFHTVATTHHSKSSIHFDGRAKLLSTSEQAFHETFRIEGTIIRRPEGTLCGGEPWPAPSNIVLRQPLAVEALRLLPGDLRSELLLLGLGSGYPGNALLPET